MKKLFLTTALIAFGSVSTSSALTPSAPTLSAVEFTQVMEAVKTSSSAVGLHTGDFQINAKAAVVQHLYKGEGSSLMNTVRLYRD